MKRCDAEGCDTEVDSDILMCPAHWRRVPRGLQSSVYSSWHARRRDPRNPEVVARHERAKLDAREAVA